MKKLQRAKQEISIISKNNRHLFEVTVVSDIDRVKYCGGKVLDSLIVAAPVPPRHVVGNGSKVVVT